MKVTDAIFKDVKINEVILDAIVRDLKYKKVVFRCHWCKGCKIQEFNFQISFLLGM
jgi:hypothetical protein